MPLTFRLARPGEYPALEDLVIDSFEPITWFKKVDERFGPLNGHDWRKRWQKRFREAFATELVLVGEEDGQIVAMSSGTLDPELRLGFIDLLAVARSHQGKGYGREMLRGMLAHMKTLNAEHAHLECLSDNDAGNCLYRSEGFYEAASAIKWFTKIP